MIPKRDVEAVAAVLKHDILIKIPETRIYCEF